MVSGRHAEDVSTVKCGGGARLHAVDVMTVIVRICAIPNWSRGIADIQRHFSW